MAPPHTNRLLSALSYESRAWLLGRCTAVTLPAQMVFYEPDETPLYGWFLNSGLAATVAYTAGNQPTGVGGMGNEGVVGNLHLLGPTRIPTRCLMQMQGTGLRIAFSELQQAFWSSTEIRARLLELAQEQVSALYQHAACHLHHQARERLASCLLVLQDRTQQDLLELTQELLAKMLGTRRSTVSMLAADLQARGLIVYSRGQVRILDRNRLQAEACDCYPIDYGLYRSLYGDHVSA